MIFSLNLNIHINKMKSVNQQPMKPGVSESSENYFSKQQGFKFRNIKDLPLSLLTVNIRKAKDLKNVELFSRSDAFVVAQCGDAPALSTDVVPNNLEPWWDQRLNFIVGNPAEYYKNEANRVDYDAKLKQDYLRLLVRDYNVILKDQNIGSILVHVNDILTYFSDGSERELEMMSDSQMAQCMQENISSHEFVKNSYSEQRGKLVVSFSLKPISLQKDIFDRALTPSRKQELDTVLFIQSKASIKTIVPSFQDFAKGILELRIQSILNLEPDLKYDFQIKVPNSGQVKGQADYVDSSLKGIKAPFQQKKPIILPIFGALLDSSLSIEVYKSSYTFRSVKLGSFSLTFLNCYELLVPKTSLLVQLDFQIDEAFKKANPQDTLVLDQSKPPKLICSMSFTHSLFTQMPGGELEFKVQTWSMDQTPFPTDYYIEARLGSTSLWKSTKRLYMPLKFELAKDTMLETLQIRVMQDISMRIDPKISEIEIPVYELFIPNDDQAISKNIVFQSSLRPVDIKDVENQHQFSLTLSSLFRPRALALQDKAALEKQYNEYKLRKSQERDFTDEIEEQKEKDINQMDIEELKKVTGDTEDGEFEKEDDMVDLKLENLPQFNEYPRGMLVVRLRQLAIQIDQTNSSVSPNLPKKGPLNQAQPEVPPLDKIYFFFKSQRMTLRSKTYDVNFTSAYLDLWGTLLQMKVGNRSEEIVIKLYKESKDDTPDICLATGRVNLSEATQQSWKKFPKEVILMTTYEGKTFLKIPPSLHLDLQYRFSKFIKMPQGKLEVTLFKHYDIKYQKQLYFPILEFRLGKQRIAINEEKADSSNKGAIQKNWDQKTIELDTQTQWENLEIRFYVEQSQDQTQFNGQLSDKNLTNLQLLGSYFKCLNSVYFEDLKSTRHILNLKRIHPAFVGFLTVQFSYHPHHILQERDLPPQAGVQMNSTSGNPNAPQFKKQGLAYISLVSMEVTGIPKGLTYNVENVRLEMNYGDKRCLSRITTDLSKTENREYLNDNFRFVIQDELENRGIPEKRIEVVALDLDFARGLEDQMRMQVVGECKINPASLRENNGEVFHYQCSMNIATEHFTRKAVALENQELADLINLQAQQSNDTMEDILMKVRKLTKQLDIKETQVKEVSDLERPQLILTFQIFYSSTPFTRSPLGLISLSDLFLLNLNNFIPDSKLLKSHKIYLEFQLNEIKNQTEEFEVVKSGASVNATTNLINKEQIALFDHEQDPQDVIRSGKSYFVKSQSMINRSYVKFQRQMVLHTCSPDDELEVKLYLEVPKDPSTGEMEKFLIGCATLNISDASNFLPQIPVVSEIAPTPIALLLDFQDNYLLKEKLNLQGGYFINSSEDNAIDILKSRMNVGSKDLTNTTYGKKMILLFDLRYAFSDIFEDSKDLTGLIRSDNIYVLPKQVKYDDYINQAYDSLVKTKLKKDAQKPAEAKSEEDLEESQRAHTLIELELKNLNSVIHGMKISNSFVCFAAIEPLQGMETLRTYIQNVVKQVQKAQEEQRKSYEIGNGPETREQTLASKQMDIMQRIHSMGYGVAFQAGEFLASPHDLIKPETQISSRVFNIADYELHPLNSKLEAWVPSNTKRLVLSLVVQMRDGSEQVETLRRFLVEQGLTKDQTLLGFHRVGSLGLLPGMQVDKVQVFQSLIDLELKVEDAKGHQSDSKYLSLSKRKMFLQQCNLSELALQGSMNLLLSSPQSMAQALVTTQITSSKFIDTPSGILKVVLRKMSHTNQGSFPAEQSYLKIQLKSHVKRSDVLGYTGSMIPEEHSTQHLGLYKQDPPKKGSRKTTLLLNEVTNFIVRHFSDQLVISLYQKSPTGDVQQFRADVELNNLELNQEKLSVLVVGTSPMRTKSSNAQLVYYTFELDLIFKVKFQGDPEGDPFEIALENYRIMKEQESGSNRVTKSEEQVIRMMLDRIALGKGFKKYTVRARRAFFTLRHMIKVKYQGVEISNAPSMELRVNPMSFIQGGAFGGSQVIANPLKPLTAIQRQAVKAEVQEELTKMLTQKEQPSRYTQMPLEKGSQVEKQNSLMVELLPNTLKNVMNMSQGGQQSLLQKFAKIMLVVTQDQQTIFKKDFTQASTPFGEDSSLFVGTKFFIRNIQTENSIAFRVLGLPQESATNPVPSSNIVLGMAILKVGALALLTWIPQEVTLPIQGAGIASSLQSIKMKVTLLFSELTRNPSKVVNVNFHRVISMLEQAENTQTMQSLSGENKVPRIVLYESPIYDRTKVTGDKFMGMSATSVNMNATSTQMEAQAGSLNERMAQQTLEDESSVLPNGLMMRVEFDNCKENEGPVEGDCKDFPINSFGKTSQQVTKELNRFTINNYKIDGQVTFKLCLGQPSTQSKFSVSQEAATLATCSFYLCELCIQANQQLNFMIPLAALSASEEGLSSLWATKQYRLSSPLYLLGSVTITDKTFGELSLTLRAVESIPRAITSQIRELQWRLLVVNARGLQMRAAGQDMAKMETLPGVVVAKRHGERIEYDIGQADREVKIDSEVQVHLQLKDIFGGDMEEAANQRLQLSYYDQDLYAILELIGWDENNKVEYVLGERQMQVLEIIQKQALEETKRRSSAAAIASPSRPQKQIVTDSDGKAERAAFSEFGQCSAKFQALFKQSYTHFNKSREEILKSRPDLQSKVIPSFESKVTGKDPLPQQAASPEKKPGRKLPDGFEDWYLKFPAGLTRELAVTKDLGKLRDQALTTIQRVGLYDEKNAPIIIGKIDFNFSYKRRAESSKAFKDALEEQRLLDRHREKKNISNLLNTLEGAVEIKQSSLLYKSLRRLGLVLAVQTPNGGLSLSGLQGLDNQEDSQFLASIEQTQEVTYQALSNIERIIQVLTSILKFQMTGMMGPDMSTFIEVMRVLTFLKIICGQPGPISKRLFQRFKDGLAASGALETLVESYLMRNTSLKSVTYTLEFLAFLGTQLADFPELYFKALSGANLDPILTQTLNIDRKNTHIVLAHAKFLDSLTQCLMVRRQVANSTLSSDTQVKLMKLDTAQVIRQVVLQIENIIDGLEVYKNAFETVAGQLCSTAMQIVHEIIVQSKSTGQASGLSSLIAEEDLGQVSKLLLSVLRVIADSMISEGTSLAFVAELKRRLTYELSLTQSFHSESTLTLSFDAGLLLGIYRALLERYAALQSQVKDRSISANGFQYFERIRVILEYFGSAAGRDGVISKFTMNAFGENNREMIGKVARQARDFSNVYGDSYSNDDFIVFLENVIRADQEIEDEDSQIHGNEKENAKFQNRQAAKEKFFNEKYMGNTGKMQQTARELELTSKKFSLSRIEWLDHLYTKE